MNYLNHYNTLIDKIKLLDRCKQDKIYYENHHIIPKAEGGNDNSKNLILLTLREHYIAHMLLAKIYGGSQYYAYNLMRNRTRNSHKYKLFRESLYKIQSKKQKHWLKENGHPKGMSGKKHTKETREKMSKSSPHRKHTKEFKKLQSERMIKENPSKRKDVKEKLERAWIKRKIKGVSQETRDKQSKSRKGMICINKDGKNKKIKKEKLNEFLDLGWIIGIDKTDYKPQNYSHCKNRIWINKDGKSKMVFQSEYIDDYSDWNKGRS